MKIVFIVYFLFSLISCAKKTTDNSHQFGYYDLDNLWPSALINVCFANMDPKFNEIRNKVKIIATTEI